MRDPRFRALKNCACCTKKNLCTDAFTVQACDRFVSSLYRQPRKARRTIVHVEDYELPEYVWR